MSLYSIYKFLLEHIYNVLSVSTVQQHESAIHIHISPLWGNFLPFKSHRALGRAPCVLCSRFLLVIYFIPSINSAHISISISQFILPSLDVHTFVHCICVSILPYKIRLTISILSDPTYMHWYTIFVFLFLPCFTLYQLSYEVGEGGLLYSLST